MWKRKWSYLALLAGVVWLVGMGSAVGDDKKPTDVDKEEVTPVPQDEIIAQADLAYGLIDFGRKNKTPEALVTAAMILNKLAAVDHDSKSDEKPKISEAHKKEIDTLLTDAAGMRPADKLLKELVERTRENLKEESRAFGFPNINKILKKLRVSIAARQKKTAATVSKQRGQTIAASTANRTARVGVIDLATGREIAAGYGSVTVAAPRNGNYNVVITAGTVAISTELSLR